MIEIKMAATWSTSEAQVWREAMPERSVDTHGVSDAGTNGVLIYG
jgi:hypothetical protein